MYFFISSNSQSNKKHNVKHLHCFCPRSCIKGIIHGILQCNCGEDVSIVNWYWSKNTSSTNIRISNSNRDTLFHPLYSSGTAVVRGNVPFQNNMHYYWEIKMLTMIYGTDVMVGVGTSKIVLTDWMFRFCSLLGIDSQSWGYSYQGTIQHDKLKRKYGSQFGLGSIVGVHLDMCTGTLEYYVNRKPLGIAFEGLKGKELYPMVSSTCAQSAVRITCAVSEEPTLQMRCLQVISRHSALHKVYKEIPGLTRLYQRKYFWIGKRDEDNKNQMSLEDVVFIVRHNDSKNKKNPNTEEDFFSDLEMETSEDDNDSLFEEEVESEENSSEIDIYNDLMEDIPSTSHQVDRNSNNENFKTGCERSNLRLQRLERDELLSKEPQKNVDELMEVGPSTSKANL